MPTKTDYLHTLISAIQQQEKRFPSTTVRLLLSIARSLKIPFEKFYLTLQKYGNISSASCAISLDEAARDGSIKTNDLICLPVFGGGLTWGSALIRW